MTALKNPGLGGTFTFDTLIYASSGLNYSAVPALSQYQIYDSPDPSYVTGRIDISAFAQLGASVPWPFQPTNVPLNGHVCIPHGRGPFPLAVFAHGNHSPLENSTPGYLYLCQLFASHGIIAATIDVNFLNGFNFGENDARAIVQLEHLKQFRVWNGTHHHPLHRKINLHRFLIIGHSRGGEGVGHASLFNTLTSVQPDVMSPVVPLDGSAGLGPYGFALNAVAAIAPTDRQYEPVTGPTVVPDRYFLIHGSRDGDVSTFEGYNTYNRAHAVNLANPTVSDGKFKALLWVFGANHNQFNSVWPSETPAATTMPRLDQERVAKVQLGALAQLLLRRRTRYLRVLRDHAAATPLMPVGADFVSQYQDPPAGVPRPQPGGPRAPADLGAGPGSRHRRAGHRRPPAEGSRQCRSPPVDHHTSPGVERPRRPAHVRHQSRVTPHPALPDHGVPNRAVDRGTQRRGPGSGPHHRDLQRVPHCRGSGEQPPPAALP